MDTEHKPPHDHFRHCPSCGSGKLSNTEKSITCASCGFTYFFNPTIGTAGFIENDKGEVLLIKRGKEPGKGKLAPPGGFADYGETAEEALTREVREETGLTVTGWRYLTSAVNRYAYKGVTYPVIDFFYAARLESSPSLDPCDSETSGAMWIPKKTIEPGSLAFTSMQQAFRVFSGQT